MISFMFKCHDNYTKQQQVATHYKYETTATVSIHNFFKNIIILSSPATVEVAMMSHVLQTTDPSLKSSTVLHLHS